MRNVHVSEVYTFRWRQDRGLDSSSMELLDSKVFWECGLYQVPSVATL
jgi:hypothetical protein